MGDDQPRYGLRSSPMKAPPPPIPPRAVLASPKRLVSPLRSAHPSSSSKDESASRVPSLTSSSSCRKLTFETSTSSLLRASTLTPSASALPGLEQRSLRNNGSFFSTKSNSFIHRQRSSSCIPVAPLENNITINRERAASETSTAAPAPSLKRQSRSRLEPLLQATAKEEDSFRAPPVPPRRPNLNPTPSTSSLLGHLTSSSFKKSSSLLIGIGGAASSSQLQPLQRSGGIGGGLSRSVATTRLLPASKVLQEEEKGTSSSTGASGASSTSTTSTPAVVEKPEQRSTQEKWSVPPPVSARSSRAPLSHSASVASLRFEGAETTPRAAVRVRPQSPSRIAKSNSGLLRSYSSVVLGDARAAAGGAAATAVEQGPEAATSRVASFRTSPRKKAADERSTVGGSEDTVASKRDTVGGEKIRRVVSTASIVLAHKEEKKKAEAPTPRQQQHSNGCLTPSASTSTLRPSFHRLPRSASSSAALSQADRAETSKQSKRDTVKPQRRLRALELDAATPPSPRVSRPAKRARLQSGADSDCLEVSPMKTSPVRMGAAASSVTPTSALPPASFFLRDDNDNTDVVMGEEEAVTTMNGVNGSGAAETTTPKQPKARRSKKMRRLEMESGEVEEEARELAFENHIAAIGVTPTSARPHASGRPRTRDSPCYVRSTTSSSRTSPNYATPPTGRSERRSREKEDVEMREAEQGPSHAAVTPISLPPAPERSAMRKEKREKKGQKVRFAHCHVYLFGREQGYSSVPATGEICLGMEARHHDEERHSLDNNGEAANGETREEEDGEGMDEELSEGEIQPLVRVPRLPAHSSPRRLPPGEKYTKGILEPLSNKQRSQKLRTSGVHIPRDKLSEMTADALRASRRACGCSCEGGICKPETCECTKNEMPCQVDGDDIPCRCRPDSCKNTEGRIEFNAKHVDEHKERVFARLRMAERMGVDSLPSPTLIRFTDDDDGPRYNATSYLETPPPAVYQSPYVSSTLAAAPSTSSTAPPPAPSAIPEPLRFQTPPAATQPPHTPPMATMTTPAADADAPHPRFPVTPVYKKYTGERPNREMPLARMALYNAAASPAPSPSIAVPPQAAVPQPVLTIEDTPSDADDVVCLDDSDDVICLDDSMASSSYATPPESNSPANAATVAATVTPTQSPTRTSPRTSPRKFPTFQSLA